MVNGQVAAALLAQAPELLAQAPELLARPPVIDPVDVLAAKLPGWSCRSKLDATRTRSDQPIVPRALGRRQ
jgi:hypothetical protein